PTAEAQVHRITTHKTQISYGQQKNGRSPNKEHGPRPKTATPGLLWTRVKEAEQNTCKNLAHQPTTCRPPRLSRPILAHPPTLSTVTTLRRNSETTEPPRHQSSATPCLPVGEFNQLETITTTQKTWDSTTAARSFNGVGRTEKASILPRNKTGDDGSRVTSISRVERLQHASRSISTASFQNGRAVTPKPTLLNKCIN
ncbi:hypothetical protein IGI04_011834, partial [Brassica rapa subsp. trilocularis]